MENDDLKVTLDFIPDNCIEEQAVSIEEFKITYSQNPDTNSDRDDYQNITFEMMNNGCGEDGVYWNIKTDKWSIGRKEDIANLFNDVENRVRLNTTKLKDLKTYDDRQ